MSGDIDHDPRLVHWREDAQKYGFRSYAAFPLKTEGRVIGACNLYAGEVNFFDAAEINLLQELTDDLSSTGIPSSSDDSALTATIIAMAHSLGIKVVTEGVETEQQAAFLRAHQCDAGQGYYFSKPLPAEEFAPLLEREAQAKNH